jgi:hypothetical protein
MNRILHDNAIIIALLTVMAIDHIILIIRCVINYGNIFIYRLLGFYVCLLFAILFIALGAHNMTDEYYIFRLFLYILLSIINIYIFYRFIILIDKSLLNNKSAKTKEIDHFTD